MTLRTQTGRPYLYRSSTRFLLLVLLVASMFSPHSGSAASYDRGDAARYYGVRHASSVSPRDAVSRDPDSRAPRTRIENQPADHPQPSCASRTGRALTKLLRVVAPLALLWSGDARPLPAAPVVVWPQHYADLCDVDDLITESGGVVMASLPARVRVASIPPSLDAERLLASCGYGLSSTYHTPNSVLRLVDQLDIDFIARHYERPYIDNSADLTTAPPAHVELPLPPAPQPDPRRPMGPTHSSLRRSPSEPLTPSSTEPPTPSVRSLRGDCALHNGDGPKAIGLRSQSIKPRQGSSPSPSNTVLPTLPLSLPPLDGRIGTWALLVSLTGFPPGIDRHLGSRHPSTNPHRLGNIPSSAYLADYMAALGAITASSPYGLPYLKLSGSRELICDVEDVPSCSTPYINPNDPASIPQCVYDACVNQLKLCGMPLQTAYSVNLTQGLYICSQYLANAHQTPQGPIMWIVDTGVLPLPPGLNGQAIAQAQNAYLYVNNVAAGSLTSRLSLAHEFLHTYGAMEEYNPPYPSNTPQPALPPIFQCAYPPDADRLVINGNAPQCFPSPLPNSRGQMVCPMAMSSNGGKIDICPFTKGHVGWGPLGVDSSVPLPNVAISQNSLVSLAGASGTFALPPLLMVGGLDADGNLGYSIITPQSQTSVGMPALTSILINGNPIQPNIRQAGPLAIVVGINSQVVSILYPVVTFVENPYSGSLYLLNYLNKAYTNIRKINGTVSLGGWGSTTVDQLETDDSSEYPFSVSLSGNALAIYQIAAAGGPFAGRVKFQCMGGSTERTTYCFPDPCPSIDPQPSATPASAPNGLPTFVSPPQLASEPSASTWYLLGHPDGSSAPVLYTAPFDQGACLGLLGATWNAYPLSPGMPSGAVLDLSNPFSFYLSANTPSRLHVVYELCSATTCRFKLATIIRSGSNGVSPSPSTTPSRGYHLPSSSPSVFGRGWAISDTSLTVGSPAALPGVSCASIIPAGSNTGHLYCLFAPFSPAPAPLALLSFPDDTF